MKRIFYRGVFACAVILASVSLAWGEAGGKGIGVIVGEPTGISGKLFLNGNDAVDVGLAWSLAEEGNFHIHGDYLRHNFSVLRDEFHVTEGQLPLYYGIGGRLRIDDDTRLGMRFVIGVSYIFEEAPVDVFFEIAPIMDLAPETELNANAGIGARFWFR